MPCKIASYQKDKSQRELGQVVNTSARIPERLDRTKWGSIFFLNKLNKYLQQYLANTGSDSSAQKIQVPTWMPPYVNMGPGLRLSSHVDCPILGCKAPGLFFFLPCVENDVYIIRTSFQENSGRLRGLNFGRNGLTVSHLFFADDSLVFFEANDKECEVFKELLDNYCKTSGQVVNFHKFEMCFGKTVPQVTRDRLAAVMGVRVVENYGSLVWGKEIIQQGYRWCIGDGNNVRVLEDPWLPRPMSFKIYDTPFLPSQLYLTNLKRADDTWDLAFIRAIFNGDDAELILGIPTNDASINDKIMWHYSRNGEYSVRSGYFLASVRLEIEAQSNNRRMTEWWKCMWKRKILPKVNHFVWKISHSWIPTKVALASRGSAPRSGDVLEWCDRYLKEFREAGPQKKLQEQQAMARWILPSADHFTINVDAVAELTAIRDGLRVGLQRRLLVFGVESDCREAVLLVHNKEDQSCREVDGLLLQIYVDMTGADGTEAELDDMKKRLKEMEDEAVALREMQAKVEKEMGSVQEPSAAASQASREEVDSRSVFVGNVDYACTPEEVQQHFQSCGTVNRVTIRTDKFGQPKGYAYVEFVEVEAVQEAILLNESELHGRQLKVSAKRTNIPGMKQFRGRRANPAMGGFRSRGPNPFTPFIYNPYGYGKVPRMRMPMRYSPYF
uniref:RRM domain-containing protein n=1 Tax=Cannabis sativa TaxID=3483 RepID=A0A803Q944_CANSA